MHSIEILKTVDFTVYKQIIRGVYSPVNISKQNSKSALCLVRSANTYIVCSYVSKEEAEKHINASDLKAFGYLSSNDIEISYTINDKLKMHQAIIKPRIIYPLSDDIALPDSINDKGKIYLDFITDEFERIKIRAEQFVYGGFSNKKISSFACRNLQILRKLFHDSSITFNKMCSCCSNLSNQSDLYIIYILNLFIIRCIVFYTEFFEPYLNMVPLVEQSLRNAFHNSIPCLPNYPWLFIHHPIIYEALADSSNIAQTSKANPVYQKTSLSEKLDIPDELLNEALEIFQLKGCIQLNCKKNVFLAEMFKMAYEKDSNGKSIFTAERKKLLKLLSFIVTDDEGNLLNPNTISSVIKPSNIKKRPGIVGSN